MTAETEQDNALVSVIVPAYNVEKYLSRCLDSILTQTYKNLEVILIDDGSTDSTGKLCDDYALKDKRISVIHQENKGLAEVRNVGLRAAKGKWIQFVDSDDWIDPEMIETCYKYAKEYNADMIIFRCVSEFEDGRRSFPKEKFAPKLRTNYEMLLEAMTFPAGLSACINFTSSSLYTGVTYPSGKLYEDFATTYKVIANAERCLEVDNAFYHYFFRVNSIMNNSPFDERKHHMAEIIQEFGYFIMNFHNWNEQERGHILVGIWLKKVHYIDIMIRGGRKSCRMDYINHFRKEIKPLLVLKTTYISFVKKMQILILKFNFRIYSYLFMKLKRT